MLGVLQRQLSEVVLGAAYEATLLVALENAIKHEGKDGSKKGTQSMTTDEVIFNNPHFFQFTSLCLVLECLEILLGGLLWPFHER